jgi:hypothetical protein
MTALPIILDTKQYTEYLAIRTGPTNLINDAELISFTSHVVTFFSRHPLDSSTGRLEVAHAQIAKGGRI